MRRAIESRIESWAAARTGRPLLVRGARRTGKTYSVEAVGRKVAGESFVKLDFQTDLSIVAALFDGPTDDVDAIMGRIMDYKRVRLDPQSAFVLFDEVQLCERALNSLRFFSGSGWRIAATGSQLGVDAKSRTLPFPSGVEQITMHPMTFEEFLWAMGEEIMADSIREHAASMESYAAHGAALKLWHLYQVVGGMPAAVSAYVETGDLDAARVQQREIDETYTADMCDPKNGISGVAARKVWRSIPAQLLRASTKKFKYAEVERGGRRAKLLEPIEWLGGAGIVHVHELTKSTEAPLVPYNEDEGSFFKVYLADTGLAFYKYAINPRLWLEAQDSGGLAASSDFAGALAENSVMQALAAQDVQSFYWMPPASWGTTGELDFLVQNDRAQIVPIEVKSSRNVRAKTLATFMERASSPFAVVLSEHDFSESESAGGRQVRNLPLYAAYFLAEVCGVLSALR